VGNIYDEREKKKKGKNVREKGKKREQ